jgi:hypothetical protein
MGAEITLEGSTMVAKAKRLVGCEVDRRIVIEGVVTAARGR